MLWLPDGEKISKIFLFVLTQLTNVTDRETHTQIPHDGIGRAYASHRAAKMCTYWRRNRQNWFFWYKFAKKGYIPLSDFYKIWRRNV